LAYEGANVVAADILPCAIVAKVQDAGGEILEVTTDVSSQSSTQALAAQALERWTDRHPG
jgi:NAD(P)-dependent dehydrogenase (short-subunit alcohol dehydrogenase family)